MLKNDFPITVQYNNINITLKLTIEYILTVVFGISPPPVEKSREYVFL